MRGHVAKAGFLFVIPWRLELQGGVNRVVSCLYDRMAEDGHFRPWVLTAEWGLGRPVLEQVQGRDVIRAELNAPLEDRRSARNLARYLIHLPRQLRELAGFLHAQGIQVVNPHYAGQNSVQFALLKCLGLYRGKLVLSFHGRRNLSRGLVSSGAHAAVWRFILEQADRITVVSRHMADLSASWPSSIRRKIAVIRNGLDMKRFLGENTPGPWRMPTLGRVGDRPAILAVGNIHRIKGQDVLIRAFSAVKGEVPDAVLLLAGREGPFSEPVRDLARSLGVLESVVFLGNVEHSSIRVLMDRADVFVLPSRSEGLPLVLLEAGASGLPVVATNVGGVPEVITDGRNGWLVPPEDSPTLACRIVSLLTDPAKRESFGRNLSSTVKRDFSFDRTYQEYLAAAGVDHP